MIPEVGNVPEFHILQFHKGGHLSAAISEMVASDFMIKEQHNPMIKIAADSNYAGKTKQPKFSPALSGSCVIMTIRSAQLQKKTKKKEATITSFFQKAAGSKRPLQDSTLHNSPQKLKKFKR